jgi:hypothetical protein
LLRLGEVQRRLEAVCPTARTTAPQIQQSRAIC